jgi:hypothetical protein
MPFSRAVFVKINYLNTIARRLIQREVFSESFDYACLGKSRDRGGGYRLCLPVKFDLFRPFF